VGKLLCPNHAINLADSFSACQLIEKSCQIQTRTSGGVKKIEKLSRARVASSVGKVFVFKRSKRELFGFGSDRKFQLLSPPACD
jgi:hypothetical protein